MADHPPGDADDGLRARKKAQTRDALREAAQRLFAERGFTATTVDDIAKAVDVSRRTFFRYYASKDELLRADIAGLIPAMVAALRSRPYDEAPLISVHAALVSLIGPDGPPGLAAGMTGPTGGLRAGLGLIRVLGDWEKAVADTLLERRGLEPRTASADDRLAATVLASAASSALRSTAQLYRARYGGTGLDAATLVPILDRAFLVLADGGRQLRPPER